MQTLPEELEAPIDPNCAQKRMTLVLLPGLDGTEVLFQPLIRSLPQSIKPFVVPLPTSGLNQYGDLLAIVGEAVSDLPAFYVLGWSFSGPLALMLGVAEPTKVRGIILSATFVRPPRPIYVRLRFGAVTPIIWMIRAARRVPIWFARGPDSQLRLDKAETWRRVSAAMIGKRVRAILTVDAAEPLRKCLQPILCLTGSKDAIVPRCNITDILNLRSSVRVRVIEGGHFAMYTNPEEAADAITEFVGNRRPTTPARHEQYNRR